MNVPTLLNNLIDELVRAREIVEEKLQVKSDRSQYLQDLVNSIDTDLARYWDYEDSIVSVTEDIEVK